MRTRRCFALPSVSLVAALIVNALSPIRRNQHLSFFPSHRILARAPKQARALSRRLIFVNSGVITQPPDLPYILLVPPPLNFFLSIIHHQAF